jgi:hypothetical protein
MAGIQVVMTSIPAWSKLGVEMGRVAGPALANAALAIGYGFWASVFESMFPGLKTKEFRPLFTPPEAQNTEPAGPPPGTISGFANGGVVGGEFGAPQLVIAHGGEEIGYPNTRGNLTFVYAPTISLADEREVRTKLSPILNAWWADAKRMRTA